MLLFKNCGGDGEKSAGGKDVSRVKEGKVPQRESWNLEVSWSYIYLMSIVSSELISYCSRQDNIINRFIISIILSSF